MINTKVGYRVYMKHVWGGKPRKLGLFEDKEEAEIDALKTKDYMYDAWVEEEVLEEEMK